MRLTQVLLRHAPRTRSTLDGNALSAGIAIVRQVLRENPKPEGWRAAEIYDMALKQPAPEGFRSSITVEGPTPAPPHPEHPVRSKTFLKIILEHMQGYQDVQLTTRVKEGATAKSGDFVWTLAEKAPVPEPEPVVEKKPTLSMAIGGHEDWSHLNKRRRRARNAQILRLNTKFKGKEVQLTY